MGPGLPLNESQDAVILVSMGRAIEIRRRAQTLGEEVANSISHGIGLLISVAALPILVLSAVRRADTMSIVAVTVFASTVILLYFSSTLYHALPRCRAKRIFRVLDHSAIFLLIAGTYTPFTLGPLRGAWGWTLFGLVWTMAAVGIALKVFGRVRSPIVSTGLYLAMGWLVVVAIKPMSIHVPASGLAWLLAGGLAYTGGVVFFAIDAWVRYTHFVWHLCVLAGTTCHTIAVYFYSA